MISDLRSAYHPQRWMLAMQGCLLGADKCQTMDNAVCAFFGDVFPRNNQTEPATECCAFRNTMRGRTKEDIARLLESRFDILSVIMLERWHGPDSGVYRAKMTNMHVWSAKHIAF
jgi:hypothetical protein